MNLLAWSPLAPLIDWWLAALEPIPWPWSPLLLLALIDGAIVWANYRWWTYLGDDED